MKILISLSSRLLGEALQLLLERRSGIPAGKIVVDGLGNGGFVPDLVLIDAQRLTTSPPTDWPEARVILVDTGLEGERVIALLLNHRVDGVITADTSPDLFLKAIRVVGEGQVWVDNAILRSLLDHAEELSRRGGDDSLSRKEREIIVLVSQGLRNREIAERLCISEQTVKAHLSRIFRKVNVSSRSQLVPLAMKYRFSASP